MIYNENEFKSSLKTFIIGFLNEKNLLKQQSKNLYFSLRDFDNMCYKNNYTEEILTKEIVLMWLVRKPNETLNNQSKRASLMRCFGYYMFRHNNKNYILPKMLYPVKEKYIPHIYSNDEIKKLFNVIDNLKPKCKNDNKPVVMPIIYRILLLTGMRINEVLSLKIKDIKKENKSLFLENTKNNKKRLIPLTDKLFDKIDTFNQIYNKNLDLDDYLFRNCHNNKISIDSFYEYFRSYLLMAKIPHTGKGPRVHDFRHTYTINFIQKCIIENKNIKVLLPYLQTYLGHDTVETTYYYYHMTLGLYPYLEEKINQYNNNIIPSLEKKNE